MSMGYVVVFLCRMCMGVSIVGWCMVLCRWMVCFSELVVVVVVVVFMNYCCLLIWILYEM